MSLADDIIERAQRDLLADAREAGIPLDESAAFHLAAGLYARGWL